MADFQQILSKSAAFALTAGNMFSLQISTIKGVDMRIVRTLIVLTGVAAFMPAPPEDVSQAAPQMAGSAASEKDDSLRERHDLFNGGHQIVYGSEDLVLPQDWVVVVADVKKHLPFPSLPEQPESCKHLQHPVGRSHAYPRAVGNLPLEQFAVLDGDETQHFHFSF